MLVGVNKITGSVTQVYAMEGGPGATPETNDVNGNGGKAGVWMGGMGFSTDGLGRIFVVTGKNLPMSSLCDHPVVTRLCNLPFKSILFLYRLLHIIWHDNSLNF
jgi:hypothetical protein